MKIKMFAAAMLAGFVLQQAALSQTNAETNGVSSAMVSNVVQLSTDAGGIAATNTVVENSTQAIAVPVESNSMTPEVTNTLVAETTNTMVVKVTNTVTPEISSALVPEVTNTLPMPETNTAESAGSGNGMAAAGESAPANSEEASAATNAPMIAPIQFADTPITAAIELLARTAGINYLLDPAIGYGQPDQNGQIKQEPTISAHWENVTPQQALLALLDNYGLELIENPKTHIARITLKQPGALPPLITRVIQLKYASTSNMVFSLESSLTDKRSRIVADVRTSQLVVVATDPEQSDIDTLIAELDKPTRQVLIETRLVELTSNPQTSKGIDWAGTLQAQNFSFGNGILNGSGTSLSTTTLPGTPVSTTTTFGGHTITTTTSPGSTTSTTLSSEPQNSTSAGGLALNTASGLTPDIGFLSADGVSAVFSFLNQSTEAQVVSTPRIVTLDNETAVIDATREFPVINVTAGTQVSAGGSTVNYSNIGTILQVTPRITANDYIWLKVVPDVSSFVGKDTESVGGTPPAYLTADIFDVRHVETQVLIPNAHTLVMGGLVQDNPNAQYTKVPILGDIPVLGFAFRSENKSLTKDNLLIFITPTIVKDSDYKPMQTDFLNSEQRTMADPMNPHTWWDSSEPRGNWSNPISPTEDKNQNVNTDQTPPSP